MNKAFKPVSAGLCKMMIIGGSKNDPSSRRMECQMLIVLFSIAALLSVLVELVLSAIERDEDKRPAGQSREDRLLLRQIGRRNDTAGI